MSTSNARLAAVAAVVLLTVEAVSLIVPRGQPNADGFIRRWTLGEIAGDREVRQIFTPRSNGFHAISFAAARFDTPSSHSVRVVLQDVHAGEAVTIAERRVAIRDVLASEWYRVDFPAISNSAGRDYALTVSVPEAAPGEGIAVEALKGNYEGALFFGGARRWGSLRFSTETTRATYLPGLGDHRERLGAGPLRIAIVASGWALFHFLALYSILALARPTVRMPGDDAIEATAGPTNRRRNELAAPPAAIR